MSDVPTNGFRSSYYDEDYFASGKGKMYKRSSGDMNNWGYFNPDGEWEGAMYVADTWSQMFGPKTMLDVGCGRGTFVAYARDFGIEAEGFDYSEWAVKHPYPRCDPSWIQLHDATKKWPHSDRQFDLVVALDVLEHLYEEDLSFVIDELLRVSGKWVFLQIATVDGVKEKGYKLKKDQSVPIDVEVYAVAGHVTVQSEPFWIEKFSRSGWLVRPDLKARFFSLTQPDVVENWKLNTVLVVERVD